MKNVLSKISQAALVTGAAIFTTVSPILAASINIQPPKQGAQDLGNLITAVINIAIIIAALLTFLFLLWGGIQWITSGGDKAAYESARNRITAALIGLAIVAAAYALFKLITAFFNIQGIDGGINIPTVTNPQG